MKLITTIRMVVFCSSLMLAESLAAQHYQAGEEGIKGGSLPAPGFYFRDDNFIYDGRFPTPYRTTVTEPGGVQITTHGVLYNHLFSYTQSPRLIWMTEQKILGANYGIGVEIPFGELERPVYHAIVVVQPGGRTVTTYEKKNECTFGLKDIRLEPLLLSWHGKQFDAMAGYALWAPTGRFETDRLSLGRGYWSHMLTLGGVYYFDSARTIALSILSRYEINHEQQRTDITYGQRATIEWGMSKTFIDRVDLGLTGYYQQAVTEDSGKGSFHGLAHVVGIGPEIGMHWPKAGLSVSLRYAYEVESHLATDGQLATLTLTKKF